MNTSPAELATPMANLNLEKPKKKQTRRAYGMNSHLMSSVPVTVNATRVDQNLYGTGQAPYGTPIPQGGTIGSSHGYNSGAQLYTNVDGHAPVPLKDSTQGSVNISNPVQMAKEQNLELSLAAARYACQAEFCMPLYADSGEPLGYKTFMSFQNVVPPMAGTQYRAVDQGTAIPKFIRSTMYNIPESENLRRGTKLPVAITVRPFAPLLPSEDPVPVVDMSRLGELQARDELDIGPPRCNRCRTFINPSMVFTSAGRFTCNICQFPNNSVPQEYACTIDPTTGCRLDREQRPELSKGVYDIVLPTYYKSGGKPCQAQGFHHVFLIDISHQSIIQQLPMAISDALRAAIFDYQNEDTELDEEREPSKFKFAILLFDKSIHYFNLSSQLESAEEAISPDLDDPFVPFFEGLFADPQRCASQIEDALNKLENCGSESSFNDSEPCFAAAVRAATMCLEQVGGGKISAVLSTMPTWGPGRSEVESLRTVGRSLVEFEKKMLAPSNKYYLLLAKDMVVQNVALDVFAIADTPVDMANIGWLASLTGGSVHKWVNYSAVRDGKSFSDKIYNSVHKTVGFQGLFKLRCSTGLQVQQYYGFPTGNDSGIVGYSNPSLLDPIIPVLTEDQAFTVLLEYDGVLQTRFDCHFQASFLYTDSQGIRKLRVVNLVTSVSERLQDVFTFVDQESVATAVLRDALSFVGKELLSDLRKSINEKIVDIFAHYRLMSQLNHIVGSSKEFVFPNSMKNFALFVLAIVKTKALRDSASIPTDLRLCDLYEMMFMPIDRLSYHLCPALVELHSLLDDEGMVLEDDVNIDYYIKVPEYKMLSERATENSVYVLCNGSAVYVRIHPETNIVLLKDLFGDHVQSYKDIDPSLDCLPELLTHISQQSRNLVKFFHRNIIGSGSMDDLSIVIARDGMDAACHTYKENLVEDRLPSRTVNTAPSYVEFLSSVHMAVNVQVQNDKATRKDMETVHLNDTLAQRMVPF